MLFELPCGITAHFSGMRTQAQRVKKSPRPTLRITGQRPELQPLCNSLLQKVNVVDRQEKKSEGAKIKKKMI